MKSNVFGEGGWGGQYHNVTHVKWNVKEILLRRSKTLNTTKVKLYKDRKKAAIGEGVAHIHIIRSDNCFQRKLIRYNMNKWHLQPPSPHIY